jgi:hypothetical protein
MNTQILDAGFAGVSLLRDTKSVGDVSELVVALALARAGYLVSKPFGENARYDLVIDDGTTLSRVQVKTGRLRNGAILFNAYSSHSYRNGIACKPYTSEIDFFGVFCSELGSVYLIPIADTARLSGTIRVYPTKNGQSSHVRWAQPYLVSVELLPELTVVGPENVDGVSEPGSAAPS